MRTLAALITSMLIVGCQSKSAPPTAPAREVVTIDRRDVRHDDRALEVELSFRAPRYSNVGSWTIDSIVGTVSMSMEPLDADRRGARITMKATLDGDEPRLLIEHHGTNGAASDHTSGGGHAVCKATSIDDAYRIDVKPGAYDPDQPIVIGQCLGAPIRLTFSRSDHVTP